MILSKKDLLQSVRDGKLVFTPDLDLFQLQPSSIDLRIGWSFYVAESWQYTETGRTAVEPDYLKKDFSKDYWKLIKIKPGQYFEIMPGEMILVSSLEKIEINAKNLMAVLHPRTSMFRRGLIIQGGIVDSGYKGQLVVPVLNGSKHSLKLFAGERICQLVFHLLTSELSEEESARHGLSDAKYAHSTAYNLEARTDSEEELELIRKGDVDSLKQKYQLRA